MSALEVTVPVNNIHRCDGKESVYVHRTVPVVYAYGSVVEVLGAIDVMGRRVRAGAGSRRNRALGRWERTATWDHDWVLGRSTGE